MALINITEFACKVCGTPIKFDISDTSTFVSKTKHEDFFGMNLTTYRVAHDTASERHYNSIVVDHVGLFRGHRDAYSEPLVETDTVTDTKYWVFHEESSATEATIDIALALLVSRAERWVIDIVCPKNLNPSETATLVLDRVEEAWRVYATIPQPMKMRIADMDLHVWASEKRVLCMGFLNHDFSKTIDTVAPLIVGENDDGIIPRRKSLNLIFRTLEENPDLTPDIVSRIMNEDMMYTTFHTLYEDRIPDIVERTRQRYPIAEEILGPLLRGYITLIEILEDKFCNRYLEVFELVDFVNRRRLLG